MTDTVKMIILYTYMCFCAHRLTVKVLLVQVSILVQSFFSHLLPANFTAIDYYSARVGFGSCPKNEIKLYPFTDEYYFLLAFTHTFKWEITGTGYG